MIFVNSLFKQWIYKNAQKKFKFIVRVRQYMRFKDRPIFNFGILWNGWENKKDSVSITILAIICVMWVNEQSDFDLIVSMKELKETFWFVLWKKKWFISSLFWVVWYKVHGQDNHEHFSMKIEMTET